MTCGHVSVCNVCRDAGFTFWPGDGDQPPPGQRTERVYQVFADGGRRPWVEDVKTK